MYGNYGSFEAAVGMPPQMRQHRVDGLRMERRERVGGVWLEAEHCLAPVCPFAPRGMILRGAEGARDHATIAQAVEDRPVPIEFDPANDVRMMADDRIGTGIDRGMGEWPLVGREAGRGVDDALVKRHQHEIRVRAG